MDAERYFLCFMFYSFAGWIYESIYYTVRHRKIVNSGFLYGCLCPIYGIGAMLDIMVLGRIENPVTIFFAGMILTGILEYFVSWLLEEVFHTRWWDYSTWPFNINGRVCLLGGIAFGIMSVFVVKVFNPALTACVIHMGDKSVHMLCISIAVMTLLDLILTLRNSESFAKRLWFTDTDVILQGLFSERLPNRHEIMRKINEYINRH